MREGFLRGGAVLLPERRGAQRNDQEVDQEPLAPAQPQGQPEPQLFARLAAAVVAQLLRHLQRVHRVPQDAQQRRRPPARLRASLRAGQARRRQE